MIFSTWEARYGLVGFYHDDGIYTANAKALATGQGYRTLCVPGELPQTKYPILYPFLLSLVWRLFPEFPGNAFLLRMVSIGCGLLFFFLSYRYVTRAGYLSQGAAAVLSVAVATSPWVVYYSSQIMSEMPFSLWALLAIYWVERASGDPPAYRYPNAVMLLAGGMAGCAYLTRMAGLAVVVAGVLFLAVKRQWKGGAWFLLAAMFGILPWQLWTARYGNAAAAGSPEAYYVNYGHLLSFEYLLSWNTVNIIFRNLPFVPVALGGLLCFPLSFITVPRAWTLSPGLPSVLFLRGLVLAGAGVVFWCWYRAVRLRLLHLYLITYGSLILITPFPDLRYWVPVFPLLLFLGYRGLSGGAPAWVACADGRPLGWRPALLALVFLMVFMINISGVLGMIDCAREHGHAFVPNGAPVPARSEYEQTFAWIRSNTPPDAVLFSGHDPMLYLYTDRQGLLLYNINSYTLYYSAAPVQVREIAEQSVPTLRKYRPSYALVVPGLESFTSRVLDYLNGKYPRALELVYQTSNHSMVIYKIHPEGLEDR